MRFLSTRQGILKITVQNDILTTKIECKNERETVTYVATFYIVHIKNLKIVINLIKNHCIIYKRIYTQLIQNYLIKAILLFSICSISTRVSLKILHSHSAICGT